MSLYVLVIGYNKYDSQLLRVLVYLWNPLKFLYVLAFQTEIAIRCSEPVITTLALIPVSTIKVIAFEFVELRA